MKKQNWNGPIMNKNIESVIKNLPTKRCPGLDSSIAKKYHLNNLHQALLNSSKKIEEGILPNLLYEASPILIPNLVKDIARKENYRPIALFVFNNLP